MERRQLDSRDKWGEMDGRGTYVTCLSLQVGRSANSRHAVSERDR